ncbi:MAG: potassium-transporting ATPase subunit KdpA [Hyphomicrobiales bacterium]|nr:potassium-transporting ATPase subunit KdpA [Hyphomicrobiales bacterium]
MTLVGWLQIGLILGLVALTARPLGLYMARVFSGERTLLSPLLGSTERIFYWLAGVEPDHEQGWLAYTSSMLVFSATGFASLYAILRLQAYLPFNPRHFANIPPDLAFNTAISFLTNTNWQAYSGETSMSNFTQMAGLTVHNFLSAATGVALAIAVTRAFARHNAATLGNFWVDITRATLYVFLPFSLLIAVTFIATGVPQTLAGSVDAVTLEGARQVIALGPVASQEAIKQFGTNGGGFFNANAAHPFENPNALANLLQIWALLAVPFGLLVTFGKMVGSEKQGWALFKIAGLVLVGAVVIVYAAESFGNPLLTHLGLDPSGGNMEGKETRFGIALSSLYAVATTATSCGGVNAMMDSFAPLGGLVPMFLMQLGLITPGGVGSGLYGLIVFAIITVFIGGLMVGRTPEFLGKKIESREVKLAILAVLILPLAILGFSAVAAVLPSALASLGNNGPHGLSEILYAYTSAAGNNGSAFAGLNANTPWWNVTTGIAMVLGRFGYVVPVMAMAGSIAAKKKVQASLGTLPTDGGLFVGLMIGVILIVGGLQFLPALALGPMVEHFLMLAGKTF